MNIIKTLLTATLVTLATASAEPHTPTGYAGPPEQLHIYLLIGQSNMAGRAPITDAEKVMPPRTLLLNAETNWEPAEHPFNQYSIRPLAFRYPKRQPSWPALRRSHDRASEGGCGKAVSGLKIHTPVCLGPRV